MDEAGFLREYLSERDLPCPGCRYNLRGLAVDRCPECHQAIELRVGLTEPRLGAFIAGLVGLSLGAGFSGLLLVYFLIMIWSRQVGGSSVMSFLWSTCPGALVLGLGVWEWVAQRRRLTRVSPATRGALVGLCWALTAAEVVVFTLCVN